MKKERFSQSSMLAQCYHDFIEDSLYTCSDHTVRGYKESMALYITFVEVALNVKLENLTVENFSASNISEFLRWLPNYRKCSSQTCNNRLGGLRAFLRYLGKKHPEYANYWLESKMVDRLNYTKPTKVMPVDEDAIKTLLSIPNVSSVIGLRYVTLMTFLFTTATRINEALSIKLGDLHLDVTHPFVTVMGKGRRPRTVYLPSKLVVCINKYIAMSHGGNSPDNAYLFYSRTKGVFMKASERGVNKQLRVYAEKAHNKNNNVPLDFHSHQFRHSASTILLDHGMNPFQISKMLGHKSIETTMTYLGISDKMRHEALKILESDRVSSIKPIWKEDGGIDSLWGIKRVDEKQ